MTSFARILAELSDPTSSTVTESDGVATYNEHNVFQLASFADCGSPDSVDSPGAAFLARVARDVADRVDVGDIEQGDPEGAWNEAVAAQLRDLTEDGAHEVSDAAVPIYTHERWQVFVDLQAYQEDVSEYGDADDLTNAAGVALYSIAQRLVIALAEELTEALDEDDTEGPTPAEEDLAADHPAACPGCEGSGLVFLADPTGGGQWAICDTPNA
jgi:hypothetical protein